MCPSYLCRETKRLALRLPVFWDRSMHLEIRFKEAIVAELVSYLPGVQRPVGDTIIFTALDMAEASRFLQVVSSIDVRP